MGIIIGMVTGIAMGNRECNRNGKGNMKGNGNGKNGLPQHTTALSISTHASYSQLDHSHLADLRMCMCRFWRTGPPTERLSYRCPLLYWSVPPR